MNILITKIIERINKDPETIKSLKKFNIKFYLFGSVIYKENPNDLDILMLYDKNVINNKDVWKVRDELLICLDSMDIIPIDLLLLSQDEEIKIGFIKNEGAQEISIYSILSKG